jgi:hypothetical protein
MIQKVDGQVLGPYDALFAGTTIFLLDENADVEEGDAVLRKLPSGKDERSVVTQAILYQRGIGSMGPHFQIKFRKGPSVDKTHHTQNIHIAGGAVQIGDHNTQNILHAFELLAQKIDSVTATPAEKAEAKSRLYTLLEHPLIVAILGAAVGSILK